MCRFCYVDILGRACWAHDTAGTPPEDRAERIPLADSGVYDEVLRTQKQVWAPDNGQGPRVLAPVTNVGYTIGVMELFLTEVTPQVPEPVVEAAHAVACRRTGDSGSGKIFVAGDHLGDTVSRSA